MLALPSPLYVDTESVDPSKIHANSVNHENVPVSQTQSERKWDSAFGLSDVPVMGQ